MEGGYRVELSEAGKAELIDRTMSQSLEIMRRRIDETGTREPTIQRQGDTRILLQVPGLGSADELLTHHRENRTPDLSCRERNRGRGTKTRAPGEIIRGG